MAISAGEIRDVTGWVRPASGGRESDPQVAEMLEAAYQKYQAYLPLHEKAMDAADADKPAAVKAADEALLQVDAMMGTLWGAF